MNWGKPSSTIAPTKACIMLRLCNHTLEYFKWKQSTKLSDRAILRANVKLYGILFWCWRAMNYQGLLETISSTTINVTCIPPAVLRRYIRTLSPWTESGEHILIRLRSYIPRAMLCAKWISTTNTHCVVESCANQVPIVWWYKTRSEHRNLCSSERVRLGQMKIVVEHDRTAPTIWFRSSAHLRNTALMPL